MKGPVAVLILIVGWIGAYFLLTESIPKHQREQTEEMPGYRKGGSILGETRLILVVVTPKALGTLGQLRVEIRTAGAGGEPLARTSLPVEGTETRVELTLPQTDATYDVQVEADRAGAEEPLRAVQRGIRGDTGTVRITVGPAR